MARLFIEAGLICLASFVAPEEAVRQKVAERIGTERLLTIHLSAPVEVCRERDTQGHYALADAAEITNFPGVSAPYEPPASPDLTLPTHEKPLGECVDAVIALLEARGILTC